MTSANQKSENCAFCLEENKLCESHIIPKWLVRERDKGSGFFQITEGNPFRRNLREGWKEKLLCLKCEKRFGIYDDYSAKFFKNSSSWILGKQYGFKIWSVKDFDYKKLKLFFMSLLWRAAVATISPFDSINLDDNELKKLKQMLENENPGLAEDFTTIIFKRESKNGLERITTQPRMVKKDSVKHYVFDLNEFPVEIKCSSDPVQKCKDFWLSASSPLLIFEHAGSPQRYNQMLETAKAQKVLYEEFQSQHPKKKQ